MNTQQITQKVVKAIEDQDFGGALALLAEDFTFSGAVPEPINGQSWIGVHRALAAAMPDLRLNFAGASEDNDVLQGTVSLTGTHTGTMVAPVPGIPQVPATGRKIVLPQEPVQVTARGGKLTNWHVNNIPHGGLPGILAQMGVALPVH